MAKEGSFSIQQTIQVLPAPEGNKRHIEVNIISWFGKEPKVDIRSWSSDRSECGKGITMSKEEFNKIIENGVIWLGKIVLRRFKKPESQESKVIRIDADIYNRLNEISEETSISVLKLTSVLLNAALADVVIIDDESEDAGNV